MIPILGLLYGTLASLIAGKFTNTRLLHDAGNRMLAHALEFRLFADDPRAIFKAQRDLVLENLRVLRALAMPILLTSAMFLLLYYPLDRSLGRKPLPEGARFVITGPIGTTPRVPEGATVEVSVRLPATRTESWRVRVITPDNALGRRPWLARFLLFAALGAGAQTAFRIARDTPNKVNP